MNDAELFQDCIEFLMSPLSRSLKEKPLYMPLYSKCGKYHYDAFLNSDANDNPYVTVSIPDSFLGPVDDFLMKTKMEPYTFFEYISDKNKHFNLDILLGDIKSKVNNRVVMCNETIKLFIDKFGEDDLEHAIDSHEMFMTELKSSIDRMMGNRGIEKPKPGTLTLIKD